MAFNGLIFVKQSVFVDVACTEIYPRLIKNVEGAGKISYMLFSKGWMSVLNFVHFGQELWNVQVEICLHH
jgi:hypothetical protein